MSPLTLEGWRGRVVLLNIWATWCGPCRVEMPTLDQLETTLGSEHFEVLTLSIDRAGVDVMRAFFDEIGIAHLWQSRPVWPILASSCSQTSSRSVSGWAAAVSAIRPQNFMGWPAPSWGATMARHVNLWRRRSMTLVALGLDLGKNWIHMVGLDERGRIVLRRRVKRARLLVQCANMEACLIGMEACCGAHHLGRALEAQGHRVRLMPPQYVKPFVKSNKNDYRDAEAAAEAVQRPTMRFVPLKSEERLDVQTIHRVRQRLVGRRTALVNQLRAILLERGITVPQRRRVLEARLPAILGDDQSGLSPRIFHLIEDLRAEWRDLDERIGSLDAELTALARQDEACRRLCEVPGIGALNATALVAAVGNGTTFDKGRDMAAWLGLVPREHSTGGRQRLLGISKRGNTYLRTQLIHGARAALPYLAARNDALGNWLRALLARVHRNVVVVALANKLARIAWAVLSDERRYEAPAAL